MKKALSLLSLAVLTVGLLGSCSKINERIDGVEKRVESIENEKIASIENQIAAINSSIADLGQIRSDISSLKQSAVNHGQDISELHEADEILKNRIDNLEDYLDVDLKKYAEKDWAIATFATLEQLDSTKMDLSALEGKVNKLGETFDGKLSDLKTNLTNSINSAINGVNASISTLEARVSALEAMIQSVSITPAYSDGSVESVDGILTLKCIVSPAEALIGMESLKDSLLIYADSVKVKTKATTPAYMTIEVSEASVLDAAQGAITLKADISEYLPKGEDKALTVAVNIKNGISDFTTEFVPVTNTTFKAVYNTNGGANTLTFYFDANDHSGDGITVYEDGTANYLFDNSKSNGAKWGYNGKRGEIKSVVIDASVAGYKGLTSTVYMFQNMTAASDISGAEYLDVSNVTDMSLMFMNFGGGSTTSHTTLNSVPDVSKWNTANVTNMTGMFNSYGNFSDNLAIVPDVSNWNTANVTNMSSMFQKYGHESQTFNAVPDVSKWNTGNVTNMANMFNEYGHKSTALNTVPDVSKWNTAKVENMNAMFKGFAYSSTVLDVVPDVSKWDTGNVTNMAEMFNGHGYKSTVLNAVPDVSKWNTGNVTNMANMFNEYGYKSTVLDTVPDVSGWNTINVTTMTNMFQDYGNSSTALSTVPNVSSWKTGNVTKISNMFQNYGYSSTALSTVPDVSKWKTGKMEEISNMFQNYGYTSQSINCTLDLSGWDLSKITNAVSVFKFNPSTFNVTIPAKTGDKANEVGNWYFGDGTDYIVPPTGKTFALPAAEPEYVEIAAKYDGSNITTLKWYRQNLAITESGKKAWKGGNGSPVKVPGTDEDVVVGDYFQWGTFAGFYGSGADSDKGLLPYSSFTNTKCGDGSDNFTFKSGKQFNQTNAPYWSGSAYTKYNAEDGKTTLDASDDVASIILGGTWRMPTSAEIIAMKAATYWKWDATDKGYYVYTPNPASDAGKVNDGTGTYNKADALLFFPTAGNGYNNTYYDVESIADYWASSRNSTSEEKACHLFFNYSGSVNADSRDSERFRGYSVRPVQDPTVTYVAVTSVSLNETSKNITVGGNLQLKATVIQDDATQQGVYWTSDKPAVATVDPYGKVTGVAAGTATITATTVDGSKTAICTVYVAPAPVAPNSLEQYQREEW